MIFSHNIGYFFKDFWPCLVFLLVSFFLLIFTSFVVFKSSFSIFKKKLFISALFSLFLIILIFSCFEAYYRYIYDESDGLGFLKTNIKWQQRHVNLNDYNGYYFRNDRHFAIEKKEGVTRIGVIGDSNSFGAGIKDVNKRYSNLLEKKLNDNGYKVEIYNLAIPGITTAVENDIYQKTKELNFDIVILGYFFNKAQPPTGSTGTLIIAKNSQRAKLVELLADKSFFFDFLYWRFSSVYQKTITGVDSADLAQYKNEQVLSQHKELLKSMLDQFKANNSKTLVVIFPYINLIQPANPLYQDQIYADQLMTSFFAENGVQYVDLLDYLKGKDPKTLMASRFDAHPNETVHKLAAEKLFDKVVPLINK